MLEIGIEASRSFLKSRKLQDALFHPVLRLGKLSSTLWLQRVLGFLRPPRTLAGSFSLLLMMTRMCGVYTGSAWSHRSRSQHGSSMNMNSHQQKSWTLRCWDSHLALDGYRGLLRQSIISWAVSPYFSFTQHVLITAYMMNSGHHGSALARRTPV